MRKLSAREMARVRQAGIKRLYVSTMSVADQKIFFSTLDTFWDGLVKDYPSDHVFWRNAVSSRMQEWEFSLGYFLLMLFALAKMRDQERMTILILVSSWQEADVCRQWAVKHSWTIIEYPKTVRTLIGHCAQYIKNILYFGYSFLRMSRKKLFSPKIKTPFMLNSNGGNILIATFSYADSFKGEGQYNDPYFGDLGGRLKDSGHRIFYITDLLAHTDGKTVRFIENCPNVRVITSLLSWGRIISIFLKLFLRGIKVVPVKFAGVDLTRLVQWDCGRLTHGFNISAEMFYEAIREICRVYDFDQLITIFEGSVTERAAIQGYRMRSRGKVCGYSHTSIFDLNLRFRLTSAEKLVRPEPDYFVCSGANGKRLFQHVRAPFSAEVYDGCTLRHVPQDLQIKTNVEAPSSILIALDGTASSSQLLDWLIENSDLLVGFQVILRCHPNVPLDGILTQTIGCLPDHFHASVGTLEDDISHSLCVFYRHSSVGLQAILNGVPAVHLSIDSPLTSDPLRELRQGKWTVFGRSDLKAAIDAVKAFRNGDSETHLEEAGRYARDFFTFPTEERVKQFISG